MTTLEHIQRFVIPRTKLAATERALRTAGASGYELFVLWSGVVESGNLIVRTCHVPKQTSRKTSRGLLVAVDGQELHKLNMWLYEHHELLGAQVHAHPTEAFHSDTDDTYPIVTTLGGLSLVVPDFARRGVLARDSAAYRLSPRGWDVAPLETIQVSA